MVTTERHSRPPRWGLTEWCELDPIRGPSAGDAIASWQGVGAREDPAPSWSRPLENIPTTVPATAVDNSSPALDFLHTVNALEVRTSPGV